VTKSRLLILGLFLWAGIASGLAISNWISEPNGSKVAEGYGSKASRVELVNDFLREYYNFDQRISLSGKMDRLSQMLTTELGQEKLQYFERDMHYLAKAQGYRHGTPRSIQYDEETGEYQADIDLKQHFPGADEERFSVLVTMNLIERQEVNGSVVRIVSFDEKMSVDETVRSKRDVLSINPGFESIVEFPCRLEAVSSITDGETVSVRISPGRRQVTFWSEEPLPEVARLVAKCKSKTFEVSLKSEGRLTTLFQGLTAKDGKVIRVKVSKQQELRNKIRRDLGL